MLTACETGCEGAVGPRANGVRNDAAFGAAGVGALRAPRWANGISRARRTEMLSRSSSVLNVTGGVAESAAPRTVKKRWSGGVPKPGFKALEGETLRKSNTKQDK